MPITIFATFIAALGAFVPPRAPAEVFECFLLAPAAGPVETTSTRECEHPTSPASTFKIPHALIALQGGVIDPDTVVGWDGKPRDFKSWERDHALDSAMKSSVYPFFRHTASKLGRERLREGLKSLAYASDGFDGDPTAFWTNGDLVVSPREQLAFLARMFSGRLAIDRGHVAAVKSSLLMPPGRIMNAAGVHPFELAWSGVTRVRAKTGNTRVNGERVSWLVGQIESGGGEFVFVSRVRSRARPLGTTAGAELALRELNRRKPQGTTAMYTSIAERIVHSLRLASGERVALRVNPAVMPELEPVVSKALERAGAQVETWRGQDLERFEERLKDVDVYVWLPGASDVTTPEQSAALRRWTDAGGRRRELHCHWLEGTLNQDVTRAAHGDSFDRMYLDALDIDYSALRLRQDEAIRALQSGEVRVTTPAGTDLRFRTGDRPFNRQDGDGSGRRAESAKMRIDRHIELPAGIVRVAPIEASVNGVIVFPVMNIRGTQARDVRFEFVKGRISKMSAREGEAAVKDMLEAIPAFQNFREFGLGFNPRLTMPAGGKVIPYYGYGAGVVRLSLGDNEELGGDVRGGSSRWNFFTDATVSIGDRAIVRDGKLLQTGGR